MLPFCDTVALAEATPVAAAAPSEETEPELYVMYCVFAVRAGPVKEGEGAALTAAKSTACAAGEAAARVARLAKRIARCILNGLTNRWIDK